MYLVFSLFVIVILYSIEYLAYTLFVYLSSFYWQVCIDVTMRNVPFLNIFSIY
jgi:hypothetical protein